MLPIDSDSPVFHSCSICLRSASETADARNGISRVKSSHLRTAGLQATLTIKVYQLS